MLNFLYKYCCCFKKLEKYNSFSQYNFGDIYTNNNDNDYIVMNNPILI